MYIGLEFYPGNPFDAVKIGIKRDNFHEVQLLHEYGMVGIGKGQVALTLPLFPCDTTAITVSEVRALTSPSSMRLRKADAFGE